MERANTSISCCETSFRLFGSIASMNHLQIEYIPHEEDKKGDDNCERFTKADRYRLLETGRVKVAQRLPIKRKRSGLGEMARISFSKISEAMANISSASFV
ncbi:hypothetical protein M514_25594 [Trichuris suis]|uniref:Uncharacterized protein n=1 Tax=Trichuris suis TaxID=68888 RepID=A0A085MYA8_9BILA|nr:hypothetical protein M514_25594 [Trichuris suis]